MSLPELGSAPLAPRLRGSLLAAVRGVRMLAEIFLLEAAVAFAWAFERIDEAIGFSAEQAKRLENSFASEFWVGALLALLTAALILL